MKAIDRKLLVHLVNITWNDAKQNNDSLTPDHIRSLIQKAIEKRRTEKYLKMP